MLALLGLVMAMQATPAPATQTPTPPTTQAPVRRPAAAPATSTMSIHVTDRKGAQRAGRARGRRGRRRSRRDDRRGRYPCSLLTMPNGTYRVQAAGEGFITLEKEVTLRAGTTTPPVEFTLTAAPPPPPPPPAPEPPPPPPAPTLTAPAGEPRVLSIIDLAERSLNGKEPTKIVPVSCSGLDATQLMVVRKPPRARRIRRWTRCSTSWPAKPR